MLLTDPIPETLCGIPFGRQGLAVAIEELSREPAPNRAELARRLCERLNWYNAAGRPQLMSARVGLLNLHRKGLLELPPPLRTNGNGRRHPLPTPAGDARSPVCAAAGQLAPLSFERVEGRSARSRLWNELIERHHYLGYTPSAGAQLRYFVHGRDGDLLALLGFGAAARALADRDRLIGWDTQQKKARLCQVVNNGRFLILPWVRSPNLASMILGGCVRHVRADFARCHGVLPLLLESFVERGRFRGSCYKAANWIHAGVTRGRGRNDLHWRAQLPVKDIWLHPLDKDFRRKLCAPLQDKQTAAPQSQHHGS
jgi:hypothetical protein